MRRTSSMGLPLGSVSGQSSRFAPGTTGHSSPHPIVTSVCAPLASSAVKFCGRAPARSRPASRMTATTSGWTCAPGRVPAEIACAFCPSAIELKKAAAICERPALWTQAKMTRFMPAPGQDRDCPQPSARASSKLAPMARVTGIGGVFIKSRKDRGALAAWYEKHLGMRLEPWGGAIFRWPDDKAGDRGVTVWHLADPGNGWFEGPLMINYRVDNLLE